MIDPVALSKELIACPSITPLEAGALSVLETHLVALGFTCHRVTFNDAPGDPTENLYARRGTSAPNLCFAGHVDVVAPGDISAWKYPPFTATIDGEYLYGRGTEDMKCAIAAFVSAVSALPSEINGSISFLITCDEEGVATNGTKKMLPWLKARGEILDGCVVGEPTNPTFLGEMAKIGRRGSAYGHLIIQGKQGHAAYPALADNPITSIIAMLHRLKTTMIDGGSPFFPPSNLEVTSVDVGNASGNVIPARAEAKFNIRFNDQHNATSIEAWVHEQLRSVSEHYTLNWRISGESFLTPPGKLSEAMVAAVEHITGKTPNLSTTGGTSDARFIIDLCPVVEFGTTGLTPHAVNERVKISDINLLRDIYLAFITRFLNSKL